MKKLTENRTFCCRFVLPAVALVAILAFAAPASAQAIIKVSDTVNVKFGLLLQSWGDWQELTNAAGSTSGFQQNLFIRRMRILMGGQVAKDVTFFLETDNANLGKAPKSLGTGFVLQDAFVNWKIANEFSIDAGLILIPLCRNCNESAASQLAIDYGSLSFLESAVTQSSVGRDTGFQARGYLAGNHLEYRAGVYQGFRQAGSQNAFRFSGRLQYNFLDAEVGPFYPGTYLGKKKVFAIGAGLDTQEGPTGTPVPGLSKAYTAYAFDGFLDLPVGQGNGLTAEVDYIHYDGGQTFTALPKQNTFMGQVGFYFGAPKILPFFRYEDQSLDSATLAKAGNSRNIQLGLTWYPYGHNFNIRAAYTSREKPKSTTPKVDTTSELTLQIQLFYF